MPFVEANYRVKPDAAQPRHRRPEHGRRAVARPSGSTIWTASPGSRASALPFRRRRPSRACWTILRAANAKLKLLWIACGKDDFLLKRNEDFIALLKEKGITARVASDRRQS